MRETGATVLAVEAGRTLLLDRAEMIEAANEADIAISKPKVTVNVTYLVGSRQEGYGETGMAHLLEHLMFRETKTRTNIKKELTDHGAQMNGSTAWDRTNYFETVNATDEPISAGRWRWKPTAW
jgi:transcriptional/translational regulatory protein YebC/TACO1